MTETLDGMPTPPPVDDGKGVVGDRRLVAVQTFDIARLTTHPVPLVPGTFVAVTGQGPKGDSNGSGKTSFLAAVSLLHGEAQWRLETDGGRHAGGLLFRPAAAGVADASYRPADHGYIVGVFADPARPDERQVTVWMRLSVAAPYVQVRHTDGLHVAHGAGDQERWEQADALWDALAPGGTFGARRLTAALYGDAPRCMAYLDTTLRPGAPSLLSQQMTEMTPERIGESLIALTGREGLLDHELEQRRRLAEQHLGLRDLEARDERTRAEEQAELAAVEDRDRSRAALADGEHLWRLHFARGYLDAVEEDGRLADAVAAAQAVADRAQAEAQAAAAEVEALRARTDLAQTARLLAEEVGRLEGREKAAERLQSFADHGLDALAVDRRRLLDEKEGWDGRSAADAAEADARAREALTDATVDARTAGERHRVDLDAVAQAEAGGGGPAGDAVAVLADAGVAAAPLLDSLTVDGDARKRWEPRLWPHRSAVVVAPADEAPAAAALAVLPGSSLVVADGPLGGGGAALDGVSAALPLGGFLTALADRTEHRDGPPRALDATLRETTVGGFPAPVAGRAARVAAAREAASLSEALLAAASAAHRRAALVAEDTAAQLAAALAADALDRLAEQEQRLQAARQDAEDAVRAARALLAPARDAHVAAAAAVLNHDGQVRLAQEIAQVRRGEAEAERARVRERQDERSRVALGYWQRGWGGTDDQARDLLAAQPPTVSTGKASSLRRRAAEALKDALDTYLRGVADTDVPAELADARQRRQQLADGGVGADTTDFTTVARPLRDLLDGVRERDAVQSDRIRREQARRADELGAARDEVGRLDRDLSVVQDMVAVSIETALASISGRLDSLNRGRGGFGAELRVAYARPDSPAAPWRWKVTPRWRRSPHGPFVPYTEVANGAQVKVFAIQLVLAALLAADGGAGRVLVLDELGNSLGDENRKDVMDDLDQVAREQDVTILGACQNSVIEDAATRCGEILWFSHASHTDALNKPTRAWGFDPDGRRVDAVAPWLREGRTLA